MPTHIPRPTLDDVAVRVGHIERPASPVVVKRDDLGLVPMTSKPSNRFVKVALVDVEGVVNVKTAPGVGDPKLRPPKPDPSLLAGHQPRATLRTLNDRKAVYHCAVREIATRDLSLKPSDYRAGG